MDQYSWSVPPEPPYILSLSPAPTNGLVPPKQRGAHVPAPPFLGENLQNDTQNSYYTPCDAVSPPLATNPGSHVFNISRFYSANASVPPIGKTLPTPPFTFGDSFPFNVDEFWPMLGYGDGSSTSSLSPMMPDPAVVPEDELSLSPNSRVADPVSETCSPPSESVLTPGSPACSQKSKVSTVLGKPRSPRRPSTRPSKKRKIAEDEPESDDGSPLLQCCMMVKPESLARHLKSDGHKRNAGLPTDRPEVCTTCNIAFARQDARNRHFRSQHGGKVPPDARPRLLYEKTRRPSATHPSILSRKHK